MSQNNKKDYSNFTSSTPLSNTGKSVSLFPEWAAVFNTSPPIEPAPDKGKEFKQVSNPDFSPINSKPIFISKPLLDDESNYFKSIPTSSYSNPCFSGSLTSSDQFEINTRNNFSDEEINKPCIYQNKIKFEVDSDTEINNKILKYNNFEDIAIAQKSYSMCSGEGCSSKSDFITGYEQILPKETKTCMQNKATDNMSDNISEVTDNISEGDFFEDALNESIYSQEFSAEDYFTCTESKLIQNTERSILSEPECFHTYADSDSGTSYYTTVDNSSSQSKLSIKDVSSADKNTKNLSESSKDILYSTAHELAINNSSFIDALESTAQNNKSCPYLDNSYNNLEFTQRPRYTKNEIISEIGTDLRSSDILFISARENLSQDTLNDEVEINTANLMSSLSVKADKFTGNSNLGYEFKEMKEHEKDSSVEYTSCTTKISYSDNSIDILNQTLSMNNTGCIDSMNETGINDSFVQTSDMDVTQNDFKNIFECSKKSGVESSHLVTDDNSNLMSTNTFDHIRCAHPIIKQDFKVCGENSITSGLPISEMEFDSFSKKIEDHSVSEMLDIGNNTESDNKNIDSKVALDKLSLSSGYLNEKGLFKQEAHENNEDTLDYKNHNFNQLTNNYTEEALFNSISTDILKTETSNPITFENILFSENSKVLEIEQTLNLEGNNSIIVSDDSDEIIAVGTSDESNKNWYSDVSEIEMSDGNVNVSPCISDKNINASPSTSEEYINFRPSTSNENMEVSTTSLLHSRNLLRELYGVNKPITKAVFEAIEKSGDSSGVTTSQILSYISKKKLVGVHSKLDQDVKKVLELAKQLNVLTLINNKYMTYDQRKFKKTSTQTKKLPVKDYVLRNKAKKEQLSMKNNAIRAQKLSVKSSTGITKKTKSIALKTAMKTPKSSKITKKSNTVTLKTKSKTPKGKVVIKLRSRTVIL